MGRNLGSVPFITCQGRRQGRRLRPPGATEANGTPLSVWMTPGMPNSRKASLKHRLGMSEIGACHNLTPQQITAGGVGDRQRIDAGFVGGMEMALVVRTPVISEVFCHEPLGLQSLDDRWLQVYYGPVPLGWFDGYRHRFHRRLPRDLKQNLPKNKTPQRACGHELQPQ